MPRASNWYSPRSSILRSPSLPAFMIKRAASAVRHHIGFVCVAVVLLYCIVHAFDPPRVNWATRTRLQRDGRRPELRPVRFPELHLTPYLLDAPLVQGPDDRGLIYTHYPQLPDLMNGALRRVFGFSELVQFRLVALAFTFCSLFFIYGLAPPVLGPTDGADRPRLVGAEPAVDSTRGLSASRAVRRVLRVRSAVLPLPRSERRTRGLLVALAAFVFFVFMASYDFWLFVPLLLAMMTFAHYRTVGTAAIRVLGPLPPARSRRCSRSSP